MRTSIRLAAIGLLGSFAALGGVSALAQQNSDGGDYRPLTMNSPEKPEVQQGALAAARAHGGAGSEGTGSSTVAAPTNPNTSSSDADQGAMAAARAHGGAGSEGIGSSTAPMPTKSGS
ncbi:MAG: hypothetical protein JSS14_28320 [Proteobacteria bacterium]|nr:hypothetical protein [Pseudomonadota bacterium]